MSPVSVGVASRRKFKKNADKPYPLAPVVAAIEAALAAPKSPDGRWPDEYNTAVAAMSSWLTSKLYTVAERYEGQRCHSVFVGVGNSERTKQNRQRIRELRADPEFKDLFAVWDSLGVAPKPSLS